MDQFDDASIQEEFHLKLALNVRKPILIQCGACHNCSEPLTDRLFCSKECSDDYEHRERMK